MVSIGIIIIQSSLGPVTVGEDYSEIQNRVKNGNYTVQNPIVGIIDENAPDTFHDPVFGDENIDNTFDDSGNIIDTDITVTDQPTTVVISDVDSDNDVPTLNAILNKLDYVDQDNDNELLQKILDELVGQSNSNTNLTPAEVNYDNITFEDSYSNAIPTDINPLQSVTPGGSMPSLDFYVPRVGGEQRVSVSLTDPSYDVLFAVAKAGLTAIFVFFSIKFTAWSAGQLLSS